MLRYLNPLTYLKWIGDFIYAWGMSLPWGSVPKTIPALILVLVLGVVTVIASSDGSSNWRSNLLKKQLMTALDADDFETAELLLTRQVRERPDDGDLLYRLAMIKNEEGKTDEASVIMENLVATKRNKEAARWLLANRYNNRKWEELTSDEREEFGSLAKLMFEEYPGDTGVKSLYADYLLSSKKPAEAMPILEELAEANPLRGLQAAALARRDRNYEKATEIAESSLNALIALSKEEPANLRLSMAVARNQIFLAELGDEDQYKSAINTLNRAIRLAKTPEEQNAARQAFGDAMVMLVRNIEQTSEGSTTDRVKIMEHLQVAMQYAPKNPRVLTLISNQVLATLDDDDEQIAALRKSLVSGSSPGVAHFIRGTAALMRNDADVASRELRLAREHMPLSSAVMNNLAVVLSQKEGINLEQPMKLVEEAIKVSKPQAPPHFYETRGQILMRMERYEDAIPDLERALAVPQLGKKAHLDLVTCYEQLNDSEMADLHRQAAAEFDQNQAIEKAKEQGTPEPANDEPSEAEPEQEAESEAPTDGETNDS